MLTGGIHRRAFRIIILPSENDELTITFRNAIKFTQRGSGEKRISCAVSASKVCTIKSFRFVFTKTCVDPTRVLPSRCRLLSI